MGDGLLHAVPRCEAKVPITPSRKPNGIETMPGLASGKWSKSASGSIASALPDTAGENTMSTSVLTSPPWMLASAPVVSNRFQNSENLVRTWMEPDGD